MGGAKVETFSEIIDLAVAGLLGLLWIDIRNIRKDKETETRSRDKEINDLKSGMFDIFLTDEKHTLMCNIAGLRIREHISTELQAMEKRILIAIKSNGNDPDRTS